MNFSMGTGSRYNAATDSWSPIETSDQPYRRTGHTLIWAGSKMVVWGGSELDTGGIYDPSVDPKTFPALIPVISSVSPLTVEPMIPVPVW